MTSDPDAQYRRDILTFIRAMTGPVDHSNPPPGVLPPSLDVEGMTPDERLLARWDAAELMRGTDPYAAGAADAVDHVARVLAAEYSDQPGYEPSWRPDGPPDWTFGPPETTR